MYACQQDLIVGCCNREMSISCSYSLNLEDRHNSNSKYNVILWDLVCECILMCLTHAIGILALFG